MKRLLPLLLCLVCGLATIQAQYRVFGHTGNVEYKKSSGTKAWRAVYNGLQISSIDSIRIYKGSEIQIEDTKTGRVYPSRNEGANRVAQLVDMTKRTYSNIIKRVNTEIQTGKAHTVPTYGTSTLATERRILNSDSTALLAQKFAWIGAQACSGKSSPKVKGFTFAKKKVFEHLDFILENHTKKDYHLNVLHVNTRNNVVSLCYTLHQDDEVTSCPVTPQGACMCVEDIFFPDTENDVYVFVATDFEYDTHQLEFELQFYPTTAGENNGIDVKYMW